METVAQLLDRCLGFACASLRQDDAQGTN